MTTARHAHGVTATSASTRVAADVSTAWFAIVVAALASGAVLYALGRHQQAGQRLGAQSDGPAHH